MEFLNMNHIKTYSKNALNEQMRCVMRVAAMLKKAKQLNVAPAIGKSAVVFSQWINRKFDYNEVTLQTMIEYFKNTYKADIEIIFQLAEEVYTYEQQIEYNIK